MTPKDDMFERADRLLETALDLPPEARAAYLDRECSDDDELRGLVDRLLVSAESESEWLAPGEPLEQPEHSPVPDDLPRTVKGPAESWDPLEPIGPYLLRERIGTGGFGDVYVADQTQPVRRRVALKILKAGMDTKSVLARFEAESQALALMDHPNIAKVFDAGETKRGLPFFAMEFVPGLSLTDYCDRQRLTTRERLELFRPVCRAVQHAHGKGIIHRDLKPTNILVTITDGDPTPKVIDFGIAKAATALTDKTLHTLHGQIMGTPAYMSPEQVDAGLLDVDTRTDVYSLGVVLYELLTGSLPLDTKVLQQGSILEMQRMILEDDPAKPSTRIGETIEAGDVATRRRTDATILRRQIRGELDWITMKALEKDRTRRYETASALATDIGRYLRDEAVEAGPPSTVYRFRKFAKRHKLALGATATVFVGVLIAAAALAYALVESTRQRARVESALEETQEARAASEAVTTFVTDMLGSANPERQGRDVTVLEVLDEAAVSVSADLADRPAIEARVRATLGATYTELGALEPAIEQLERATELNTELLGEDHRVTLDTRRRLATAHRDHGDLEVAEGLLRDVLAREEAAFGVGDSATAFTLDQLGTVLTLQGRYEDAEEIQSRADAVGRDVFGEDDARRAKILANLGVLYRVLGRHAEAREALANSLVVLERDWGEENPNSMNVVANLANVHYQLGEYEEAAARMSDLAATKVRVLGEEHPSTLQTQSDLAVALGGLGRYAEAESLGAVVLEARRRTLGDEHPGTLQSLNNQAGTYRKQGRLTEAEPLLRESLETKLRVLGADHRDTIITEGNLGDLLTEMGRAEEALPILEAAVESARRALPEDHAHRADVLRKYGECLRVLDRYAEAEAALLVAHERLEAKVGPDHVRTQRAAESLAKLYEKWGKAQEAQSWRVRPASGDDG